MDTPLTGDILALEDGESVDDVGSWMARILFGIHREISAPFVTDYHIEDRGPFGFHPEQHHALGEVLDQIVATFNLTWTPVAGIHTFRDNDWYLNDALEVPTIKLRRWLNEAKLSGKQSVDELAEMAQLSDSQLGRLEGYNLLKGLREWMWDPDKLAALRLWGRLTPAQRQRAKLQGLATDDLSTDQASLLDQGDILQTVPAEVVSAEESKNGNGALTLSFKPGSGTIRYDVSFDPYISAGASSKAKNSQSRLGELSWATGHPKKENQTTDPHLPGRGTPS